MAAENSAAILFAGYASVLLWHHEPPALGDYPNWTYQGVLLARHLHSLPDPAHWLKPYPVPNSAATLIIALFSLLLPWTIAAKLWLCVQLAISYATTRMLLVRVGGSGLIWFLLPQAVFLNVNFWYGFENFQLGICWVYLIAALLLEPSREQQEERPARLLLLSAVYVIAFFTHMIPFAFACLLLFLYAQQTRRWRTLYALLPAALLSLWYIFGRFALAGDADGQVGMVSPVRYLSSAFWAYKVNSYLKSFGLVNPHTVDPQFFGREPYLALFIINATVALLAGWMMLRAARRAYRVKAPQRFLWTACIVLLPAYLFAPGTALGVSDPGSRLLQAAIAVGLALSAEEDGWCMTTSAAGASVLALASFILFVRFSAAPQYPAARASQIPTALARFAGIPNDDMLFFYDALRRGDYRQSVFPTGMFLNTAAPPGYPSR